MKPIHVRDDLKQSMPEMISSHVSQVIPGIDTRTGRTTTTVRMLLAAVAPIKVLETVGIIAQRVSGKVKESKGLDRTEAPGKAPGQPLRRAQ